MSLYTDRREGGRELSKFIQDKIEIDSVVIPYQGALPVALEVGKRHNTGLSLRLADFIRVENQLSANIGAVAQDGTLWIEEELREELGVSSSHIEDQANEISPALLKESASHDLGKKDDLKGQKVAVVSEGISSGFREAAVAGSLLKAGAGQINVIAPFKSRKHMADLESLADNVLTVRDLTFISSPEACYASESGGLSRLNRREDPKVQL
ncbi:MAG: hypothetical protein ABEJ56_02345 [Candidatus Nanohaloarchaea archaeon]